MRNRIVMWIKKEMVLIIAGSAAMFSMLFHRPDRSYMEYIDYRVLVLLFCLMAVVAGLQKNGVFTRLALYILKGVKTTRSMCFYPIMLCFFTSMWITNDVALITFVPFSILLLDMAGRNKYMTYVIVMETVAANLGSMLTPVGNPQNLYLYSHYGINGREFLEITLPVVVLSFLILIVISLFVGKERICISKEDLKRMPSVKSAEGNRKETLLYFGLFLVCLGTVLHFVDYRITLVIVLAVVAVLDKRVLKGVDYSLLLTFVCFFVFVGNLSNMGAVKFFLSKLIQSRELISAILLSQVISNVPAAVLLSNFTSAGKKLVLGTNIGGLGTIVASLASLISYRFYIITKEASPVKYLAVFSAFNMGILLVLYCAVHWFY